MRQQPGKGNLLGRRAWYVRDRWGDDAVAAIARAVPESARKFLEAPPLTFAWPGTPINIGSSAFSTSVPPSLTRSATSDLMRRISSTVSIPSCPI